MSILSAILAKRQAIKEGLDYLEQEVLSAILALVEKIEVCIFAYSELRLSESFDRMQTRFKRHTSVLK